jgi:hypothetical protein
MRFTALTPTLSRREKEQEQEEFSTSLALWERD